MRLHLKIFLVFLSSTLISLTILNLYFSGYFLPIILSLSSSPTLTNVSKNIPSEFRFSLWRPTDPQEIYKDDRITFQWEWIEHLSQSEYMKTAKTKRILITGGFMMNKIEKQILCHKPGLNFSSFCEFIEDFRIDPRYPNYDEFDAILNRRDWYYQFYEPRVPPDKISIFDIQESPYTLHQGDFRINNPILASYWRGSDIVAPYYKWIPFRNSSIRDNSSIKKNYSEGKTKLAAMVASHCPTYNERLLFVQKLQKYIPIDVYGSCGPFKCDGNCLSQIQKDYKFYLAFENANCRDYITEKLFKNALSANILPVVLGAHKDDYLAAAPPHSYIHIEDFESPEALAEYLLLLDQNEDLYNSYFEWKGKGEIINGLSDTLCRVCGMLFYADFYPPPKWPQDSFSWLKVNPCLKPGEVYWASGQLAYS